MDNYNYNYTNPNMPEPGKGQAIASMVLGIISCVIGWVGYSSILGLGTGFAGLILWSTAKKRGYTGDILTAGFILSLIGTILSALVFVACIACIGCAGCSACTTGGYNYYY